MDDFILFIAFVLLAYFCSVAFVVAMVRVFFPLKSKEEWSRVKALKAVTHEHRVSRVSKVHRAAQAMMDQNGQLA